MYHGDITLEDTIDIKFTTRSFSTGAPTTLAGTPVISAYPGNSVTQLTAGITLTVDFDSVTGLHNVRVVATAANGYATATNYSLVITTGTVGGVSVVGEVIGTFSISARSALRPTVATRTLDVSAGGEAGVDWANIGSPTTANNLSATNIDVDQIVASVSGAVGSVTGLTAATIHSDLDDIQSRLPAALVSGRMDSDVAAIQAGAITAAAIATGAIDADALAADAVDEILDEQIGDGTLTLRQAIRLLVAALAAKVSGMGTTTVTFRNAADTANVIVATVDADGNRSAVTQTP